MRSRFQPWFIVVLVFMGIGLIDRLLQGSAQTWIIPLVLVALVFVFYKFPPSSWQKPRYRGHNPGPRRKPDFRSGAKPEKRRPSPFTVIEGRKNKEDEPPRFH